MKGSIDSKAHIVDPATPAFLLIESEEETFYRLVKNVEETEHEARKIQQQRESATVDLTSSGGEQQPSVQDQFDYGEATGFDGVTVRKTSDNSSSGISVTSSEYIRFGPSQCCSTDCTGRTSDSGLGWTSSSLGLKDVLVSTPSVIGDANVLQIESDYKKESGVPKPALLESDVTQLSETHSSTHHLTYASTERSTETEPGFETLVDAVLDDDGGDYANKETQQFEVTKL